MRVLIIQRFDLASVSCARRVLSQTQELMNLGHDVILADMPHPKRQEKVGKTLKKLGLPTVNLDRKPTSLLKNLRRLEQIPKPDVVHLWKSYPDASIPALTYAWKHGIPLHYDWDDWEEGITLGLTQCRKSADLMLHWEKALCRWSDSVSVASQALRDAAENWGCPPERLVDLPVGVDTDRFFPRPADNELISDPALKDLKRPILVYLGQLEVESYVIHCVDVLKHFREKSPEATLLIVGGGRLTAPLEQAIAKANLQNAVHITGYIDADEVPRYLSLADIALAPFEDNQVTRCKSPLKIAEYAAMGLPVVAADVGEAGKMLKGRPARLVPPSDTHAMADAAFDLLNHPHQNQQPETEPPQDFTWRRHAEILAETYQKLLSTRQS